MAAVPPPVGITVPAGVNEKIAHTRAVDQLTFTHVMDMIGAADANHPVRVFMTAQGIDTWGDVVSVLSI